jgi:formamidopyrimidine-DNA glycosylase
MPELPEVETTVRGIAPFLEGKVLRNVIIRESRLRWPVIPELASLVDGLNVTRLQRRGKYILIHLERGGLIIHLGMSGSMRVLLEPQKPQKHDHFDLVNSAGQIIRYRDPRKFGSLLYFQGDPREHPRLAGLGVEPLTDVFDGEFLYNRSKKKNICVKTFLMDGRIVVGVGNIYASESLHLAGINPLRKCSRISLDRYRHLAKTVKKVLELAIERGGTTLQDFVGVDGSPGYFEQELMVYGRAGHTCDNCGESIRKVVISQRATYYCDCQT